MRQKKLLLVVVLMFLGVMVGFAQSNALIDEILAQKKLGYSYAAYLVLSAAGVVPDTATPEQALEALSQQDWGIEVPEGPADITLGQYAYLLMRAFDIPGGLMYRLIPGPRYAAREIAFLGFVAEKPSPYRNVSGEEALQILGNVLNWKEEQP
ncbi:MAG TPA: hypothetical protein PLG79_11820 [Spirochaetales bacterium]|nr:hypothetical protein [Spirochaetales bacterium]